MDEFGTPRKGKGGSGDTRWLMAFWKKRKEKFPLELFFLPSGQCPWIYPRRPRVCAPNAAWHPFHSSPVSALPSASRYHYSGQSVSTCELTSCTGSIGFAGPAAAFHSAGPGLRFFATPHSAGIIECVEDYVEWNACQNVTGVLFSGSYDLRVGFVEGEMLNPQDPFARNTA